MISTAGAAQAEVPQLISYGSLSSSPSPVGVAVDNSCTLQVPPLAGPACTAFDPSAGDIYVAGLFDFNTFAPGHIDKFSPTGQLIAPAPFGGAFYGSTAVNPTNGDVYTLEALGSRVITYDSATGDQLSSFPVPPSANVSGVFTVVQIATDSAGNVYVPVMPADEVRKYDPSGTLLTTFTGSGDKTLAEPTGVALDASDDLWVADSGNDRIVELKGATGAQAGEIESEGVRSVALDREGDAFAILYNSEDFCGSLAPPCAHLVKYGPDGERLANVGAGKIGQPQRRFEFNMVAVSEESGRAYVADPISERVWIFGPPTAPAVESQLVAEVTESGAKLGAVIAPGGVGARYHFEYGQTAAYGNSAPVPDGYAGGGVAARTVWASVSGLTSETTYHYRVVASNPLGEEAGPDRTFTTSAVPNCGNERFRIGFSGQLPDCRAYELVTPPTSNSAEPDTAIFAFDGGGGVESNQAAVDGIRMSYRSAEPIPGATSSGFEYVATRGATEWTSENVTPRQSYAGDRCISNFGNDVQVYSSDLTLGVFRVGAGGVAGESTLSGACGAEGLEIVEGEPLGVENLLLRDNPTDSYDLVNTPPSGVTATNASFKGASSDLSKVVFGERAALTAEALTEADNLYEWDEGSLRLVTVLRDGTPVTGSLAAPGGFQRVQPRVISTDGDRVFFTAEGKLYVRVNGVETVQLDEPRGGAGPGGGGMFQGASADGNVAYFTDDASAGLTSDTESGSGNNLYRYSDGLLADLTPAGQAEVVGVSAVSKDGSFVYFVAEAALTGAEENQYGETAEAGQQNLYLWKGGDLTFVAGVNPDSLEGAQPRAAGAFFAFTSKAPLTGYDNTVAGTGEAAPEIFIYDATSDRLACVSCDPSGQPPVSGGAQTSDARELRQLIPSGRLFFQTEEALLPRDTNGEMDVYEYEGGHLHLISSGTSSTRAWLLDASETGDDVFFLSRASLVPPGNPSEALVIYDARVGGGFSEAPAASPCSGDECRGASTQAPPAAPPGSSAFVGTGNVREHVRERDTCGRFGHTARKLSHRARRLRRNVKRSNGRRQARRMRRRAKHFVKRARKRNHRAKRCRRANQKEAR